MSLSRIAAHLNPFSAPQSEPAPGKSMVPNAAGGFTFAVDDWTRLDRFLILGTEGGTYYASERAATLDNAGAVKRCVLADGPRTVARIVEISQAGRAPKNGPAILALALAAEVGDVPTKAAAYKAVAAVCRTGTHLFEFAAAKKALGGAFGAGMRRAVGRWYTEKSPNDLAYQVVKYRNRAGFTHRDLLRLARPKGSPETDAVLRWCVRGRDGLGDVAKAPGRDSALPARQYAAAGPLPPLVAAFDDLQAKAAADGGLTPKDAVRFVTEHRLPWECLPSDALAHAEVWDALLPNLPMTATVRNLATLTRAGVLAPNSAGAKLVCDRLRDAAKIRKARLHPLAVLLAARTYASGKGDRSNKTWEPNDRIVDALNDAFYLAFDAVPKTGKRWVLGLDVSGSMGSSFIAGTRLSAREASAAMAMVTLAAEPEVFVGGFTAAGGGFGGRWGGGDPGFTPIKLGSKARLDAVCKQVADLPMGGTDCALPMLYAAEHKIPADVFVVYTDNETWAGAVHPFAALQRYRDRTGIPAKLAVVGMTATEFTIADPSDAGMMDVVGFDAAAPGLLAWFAGGDGPAGEATADEM